MLFLLFSASGSAVVTSPAGLETRLVLGASLRLVTGAGIRLVPRR